MSVQQVLDAVHKARRTGPGRWMACCPAHSGGKERTPSLSVREVDRGVVLLKCFHGCNVEEVVGAMGLRMEDLFPPRDTAPGAGRQAERRPFSVRDLIDALAAELRVAWVLLADLKAGKPPGPKDRQRAGIACERVGALIEELRHVR